MLENNPLEYSGTERRTDVMNTLEAAIDESCKIMNAMVQKLINEGLHVNFSYREGDDVDSMKELHHEALRHVVNCYC